MDGLNAEFYLGFWQQIGPILVETLNVSKTPTVLKKIGNNFITKKGTTPN